MTESEPLRSLMALSEYQCAWQASITLLTENERESASANALNCYAARRSGVEGLISAKGRELRVSGLKSIIYLQP